MPAQEDLPSTLRRSPEKAQDTYAKAYDSAARTYGAGERARRTAFAAVKHSFEKVGDHWEPKERKGPSDERAAQGYGSPSGRTAGGVDANATREHLLEVARRLQIPGRSRMRKSELIEAIQRANERMTRQARQR